MDGNEKNLQTKNDYYYTNYKTLIIEYAWDWMLANGYTEKDIKFLKRQKPTALMQQQDTIVECLQWDVRCK